MENNSIEANMSAVVFHIAEVCGKRNMSVFRFVYFILILFTKKPFLLAITHSGNYRLIVLTKCPIFSWLDFVVSLHFCHSFTMVRVLTLQFLIFLGFYVH